MFVWAVEQGMPLEMGVGVGIVVRRGSALGLVLSLAMRGAIGVAMGLGLEMGME